MNGNRIVDKMVNATAATLITGLLAGIIYAMVAINYVFFG